MLPATLSIVTNVFDRDERPKAIAIWTAVGGLGIGLGPAIGGYLVDRWDWSAAFWIHVPVIAIALIGQIFVPESRDPRNVGLDVTGAIAATGGITALVYGVIQGSEAGGTSSRSSDRSRLRRCCSWRSASSSAPPSTRCCRCTSSARRTSPAASSFSGCCSSRAS